MNSPLYKETIRQATMEDYCRQDRAQCYRQLKELSEQRDKAVAKAEKSISRLANAEAVIQGQNQLLDQAIDKATKEETRKKRWRRLATVGGSTMLLAGFVAGALLVE